MKKILICTLQYALFAASNVFILLSFASASVPNINYRTTWGNPNLNEYAGKLFEIKKNDTTSTLIFSSHNILSVNSQGNITKNFPTTHHSMQFQDALRINEELFLALYTPELSSKKKSHLILFNANTFSLQKSIVLPTLFSSAKIITDTQGNFFIIGNNKSGITSIYVMNNQLAKVEHLLNTSHKEQLKKTRLIDGSLNEKNNALLLITTIDSEQDAYFQKLPINNPHKSVTQKKLRLPDAHISWSNGRPNLKAAYLNNKLVLLTDTQSNQAQSTQQQLIFFNDKYIPDKSIRLKNSARFGSELAISPNNTLLIACESKGGHGLITEINDKGETAFEWISDQEKHWSPATTVIKTSTGYITALETAFSEKHQQKGTRGISLIKLTHSPQALTIAEKDAPPINKS
ncbi:MAG: hypothetical protein OXE99_02330 [Cellvibrionales bacterium]|nr:hypothetical protein [Cellvibrionales bacterium]